MNRRSFIGALAALVAAPAVALRTKFEPPKPIGLTYKGVPVVWDAHVPQGQMYFVNPQAYRYEAEVFWLKHPRKLGVITNVS